MRNTPMPFPHLFFSSCILVLLSGPLILLPLGIRMITLSCLFLKIAGILFSITGFLLGLFLLRIVLKSLRR